MNVPMRHGDIPLHPVNKIAGVNIAHKGEYIVAEGETTGHMHRLRVVDPNDMTITRDGETYFITLRTEGTLTHEEHGTLTIAPGMYRIGREKEKDWFSLSVRKVID